MGYCSSIVDLLQPPPALFTHRLLFIQPPPHAPPPATIQPALSMRSFLTTPTWATVHPALHRLLFNQPSTGSCGSSPPWGPVHPPPTGSIGVLFIQRQRPLLPRGPVHPTPTRNCSSNPPTTLHCSSRGSVDRLQLAEVAKESLDRV